jgi:hypothetical protein
MLISVGGLCHLIQLRDKFFEQRIDVGLELRHGLRGERFLPHTATFGVVLDIPHADDGPLRPMRAPTQPLIALVPGNRNLTSIDVHASDHIPLPLNEMRARRINGRDGISVDETKLIGIYKWHCFSCHSFEVPKEVPNTH